MNQEFDHYVHLEAGDWVKIRRQAADDLAEMAEYGLKKLEEERQGS
jgi:hypothetical protein